MTFIALPYSLHYRKFCCHESFHFHVGLLASMWRGHYVNGGRMMALETMKLTYIVVFVKFLKKFNRGDFVVFKQ